MAKAMMIKGVGVIKIGDYVEHSNKGYSSLPSIGVIIKINPPMLFLIAFPKYPDGLWFYRAELVRKATEEEYMAACQEESSD